MQTLTIQCNDEMASHLSEVLKNLQGVLVDSKTVFDDQKDVKQKVQDVLAKYEGIHPFASIDNAADWQREIRSEW